MALFLVVQGVRLAGLGGSFYYAVIGLVYLVAAYWAWRNDERAAYLVGGALFGTLVWALVEVGTDYWGLFPRLLVPLAIFCAALFLFSSRGTQRGRWFLGGGAIALIALIGFFARGFVTVPVVSPQPTKSLVMAISPNTPVNWMGYSRDTMGTRYSPFTQINRDNVRDLTLAWTCRTGRDTSNANMVDQNTPLQIGNTLYSCTPENAVHAINATTGKRQWPFEAKASAYASARCRELGYFQDQQAASGAVCAERIIGNTIDGRLFALDSRTGALCPAFGTNGVVDLRANMGAEGPG